MANLSVVNGAITLTGQESLTGLTVAMLPIWNAAEGALSWQRSCTSDNTSLRDSCLEQFRFADKEENNG